MSNLDGSYGSTLKSRTAETIQAWLISQLAERLGIPPSDIDIREPFASYGLSSREAVSLEADFEDWLGREIPATLVWEYPSIAAITQHLAEGSFLSETAERISARKEIEQEPIAIIGIGCRFPGAADPQAFWQLLRGGVDAVTEVPPDRWDLGAFYDRDMAAPGKMNTRWGGFLEQVDQFDPHFFGISPREATRMDPQQRLLLEVAWEALEDAGQVQERLAASPTGVFIGISTNDYGQMQLNDTGCSDAYVGTGSALSIAANRLSYFFDFRGPSLAVDTACSSSLVAVHLACRSLWEEEATLALAGGVNVILSPAIAVAFTKAGFMAPDGRCRAFDTDAQGYVRGEGVGVVVLKRLAHALSDGDLIYALIRGSAVNQDGRTNGITAPNRDAQEEVLREAYRRAGVSPSQIHYVEAHGTGTSLGDPIEAKALGAVLATERPFGDHCALGSVKTNIGHLEAAAGIAGLIKVALMLRHREIPPSLHFLKPNPYIPFDDLPLRVQQKLEPWPEVASPALAGVSSFGFGGTNAHIVLEEGPWLPADTERLEGGRRAHLLPLSARSPQALESLARAYHELLSTNGSITVTGLRDTCYAASVRRTHHDYRLALVADSPEALADRLEDFLQRESHPGIAVGHKRSSHRSKLVFVFPGQGSQRWAMGRELLEQEPIFRTTIERCDELMGRHVSWSLVDEMAAATESRLDDDGAIAQPALFALQIALAALWRSWGLSPDAVVGHSMGEVAAAHVAGALSLSDAVGVILHRSELMQRTSGQGRTAAVEMSLAEAEQVLAEYRGGLTVAAHNGPTSVAVSGEPVLLKELLSSLKKRGIFSRLLRTNQAFHSEQMEPLKGDLVQALQGVQSRWSKIPIFSTVTGDVIDGRELGAEYWGQHLRRPVQFAPVIYKMLEAGHDLFLEISPHPVLGGAITACLHDRGNQGTVLPSLRRGKDERTVLLESLGTLFALGLTVDWRQLYPSGGHHISLPAYPWQRERCWIDSGEVAQNSSSTRPQPTQIHPLRHPLLGSHVSAADSPGHHIWETDLSVEALSYLEDCRVLGAVLLPASAYAEAVAAAALEGLGGRHRVLTDFRFRRALFVPMSIPRKMQIAFSRSADGTTSFGVYSRDNSPRGDQWVRHAEGKIDHSEATTCLQARGPEPLSIEAIKGQCPQEILREEHYINLQGWGLDYGPRFRGIRRIWRGMGQALAELAVPEELERELSLYQFHPALLDACFQVLAAATVTQTSTSGRAIYIPCALGRVLFYGSVGRRFWSHARLHSDRDAHPTGLSGDIRVFDEAQNLVAEVLEFRLEQLNTQVLTELSALGKEDGRFRPALLAMRSEERLPFLTTYLEGQVARVLRLPGSRLGVDQSLSNLGFDSIMAMELRNQIETEFGIPLSIVKFLEGPSINQLANLLLDELLSAPSIPLAPRQRVREDNAELLLERIDQLSDQEVDLILRDMLAEQGLHEDG